MAVGGGVGGLAHGGQDGSQRLDVLQVAQAGGVGAGDVDDEVVDPAGDPRGRVAVVLDGVVQGDGLGLADIGSDDDAAPAHGGAQGAQAAGGLVGPGVVEAHPVAQGARGGVAPHAGLVVAGLGPGGEGADLDEAEAEHVHALDGLPLLVHAGRQSEQAGHGPGEGAALVVAGHRDGGAAAPHLTHGVAHQGDFARDFDGLHADVVDDLGVDPGEDGLVHQVVEHAPNSTRSRVAPPGGGALGGVVRDASDGAPGAPRLAMH